MFFPRDHGDKVSAYFTRIFSGREPISAEWQEGKIVLLPKRKHHRRATGFCPITLTSCLRKFFSRIVMQRLHSKAPEYRAGQLACRNGVQTVDGRVAAHFAAGDIRQSGKNFARCQAGYSRCVRQLAARSSSQMASGIRHQHFQETESEMPCV